MSKRIAHNKLSTQHVKNWAQQHNILLLDEEYVNNVHKHRWLCQTHNEEHIAAYDKIRVKAQLKCCSVRKRNTQSMSEIMTLCTSNNITLDTHHPYTGNQRYHNWTCNTHQETFPYMYSTLRMLKDKRLPCCKREHGYTPSSLGRKRYTINEVKRLALDSGYIFLDDTYDGISSSHSWLCGKHNEVRSTSLGSILQGRLLKCCDGENRSGTNHPNYNHAVSDIQRFKDRRSDENKRWRSAVVKRDNHTCQKCNNTITSTKLNVHHIMSYLDNEPLRFDVDNGITLCVKCHTRFHKMFGKGSNNVQQLLEFMNLQLTS